jgi:long-chain acyl-CoA synthetase
MQLIEREKVNQAGGVPTIAWQLIEHPAREKYDLSSLEERRLWRRAVGARTGAQDRRDVSEIAARQWLGHDGNLGHLHHAQRRGLRAPPRFLRPGGAGLRSEDRGREWRPCRPARSASCGRAGPNIVKGYWNKPEATAQTFVDGWVKTGDLARLDEEGFCFIIDRAKDMLIRGGENIYCIEVENALYEHPAVMDAALVGHAAQDAGRRAGRVVHLKPACMRAKTNCAPSSPASWRLQGAGPVVFWPETLPRNANGKILKTELKKIFATSATVQASNFDGTLATLFCQPGFRQTALMGSELLSTSAMPGDVTVQLPRSLESTQVAPVVGGVATAMDCELPSMIVAQPDNAVASSASIAMGNGFIRNVPVRRIPASGVRQ